MGPLQPPCKSWRPILGRPILQSWTGQRVCFLLFPIRICPTCAKRCDKQTAHLWHSIMMIVEHRYNHHGLQEQIMESIILSTHLYSTFLLGRAAQQPKNLWCVNTRVFLGEKRVLLIAQSSRLMNLSHKRDNRAANLQCPPPYLSSDRNSLQLKVAFGTKYVVLCFLGRGRLRKVRVRQHTRWKALLCCVRPSENC